MRNLVRSTPLSLPMTLLVGWGPCILANGISALAVIGAPARELWFHAFVLLFYSSAALPLKVVLRLPWLRQLGLEKSVPLLAAATLVLAFAATMLGYAFGLHVGEFKPPFQWSYVLTGMQSIWFLLMVFCAMDLGIGYYLATQQESRRALEAAALRKEAELRALRYQLNPHFLFNTLNAISTLVVDRRTNDATRMLARLGDFLRATLDDDKAHEVALADELSLTEHYLDIEKVRFGDRLAISLRIGPEAMRAAVPYLLLQPLVENAIRHGIARRRQGGRVDMAATVADGRLNIRIFNEGNAHPTANLPTGWTEPASIGMRNVRERLQRLYADDHRLSMRVTDDGDCLVLIELPFKPMSVASDSDRALLA
ncbi:sensor histidine kinase [Dyella choica]|uniref:Sensor histidine kinase n=1 Tax=Dyella choica TaxID=1927959 RepID=A0A432M6V1_9GAMM|nr:histidine kinase [Dyella choica]RUL76052.1 sensor histidine kinase [Dyella choica]